MGQKRRFYSRSVTSGTRLADIIRVGRQVSKVSDPDMATFATRCKFHATAPIVTNKAEGLGLSLHTTDTECACGFDRSVDVQVLRLRRKLEIDPSAPRIIRTERGLGYVFALPVERL